MRFSNISGSVGRASQTFEEWFPTPRLLNPQSLGVDISDSSVKWLGLAPFHDHNFKVQTFGSLALAPGIVTGGLVRDPDLLGAALHEAKTKFNGIECAHAALPEEAAYVFSMHVPEGVPREQILRLIEFEFEGRVPIPPSAAIYDYDVIEHDKGSIEIGVAVFPREVAEGYIAAFNAAGIELMSLEIEARSIARAVSDKTSGSTRLLVDFGLARTGFALLKRGIPIFTSTVDVGGDAITKAVVEGLSLSLAEAEKFKNEEGLLSTRKGAAATIAALTTTATVLSDEISKHFHYWDTRRDVNGERVTPVESVVLVGGSSNLKGLAQYVAGKVQAPVEIGDVWHNVCTFDEYIPPIDIRTSLQYATSVGLALRGI